MNSITGSVPLTLACHPETPSQAIQGFDAVADVSDDSMTLAFTLEGDLSRLRIPEPRSPRRASGLWLHTCFEVFVMAEEGPGYREFNLSPSGEWAAYAFRDYRGGAELYIELSPEIVVRRSMARLQLDVKICRNFLPVGRPLRLGLAAVVEDVDGVLSYWALRHPPGKPDFHHIDGFAIQPVVP
jgi:hypothetical protein